MKKNIIGKSKKDEHLAEKDTIPISDELLKEIRDGNNLAWNEWVRYEFKFNILSDAEKIAYTFFCVGFLAYYDQILRNTAIEHTVFLDWGSQAVGSNNLLLRIFISPRSETGNLYPEVRKKELIPTKDLKNQSNNKILASYGFTSDPPPPPPPPPPVM